MSVRDRFFTPSTARALLSWRIIAGLGAAIVLGVVGLSWPLAVVAGIGLYGALVWIAMPKSRRSSIDPFAVGEPWRQLVQQSQSAARKLNETVRSTSDGPLRQRLTSISHEVDRGLDEAWAVAQRGNDIDAAVSRLDPTALRSRLATLQSQQTEPPSANITDAISSVETQLGTADRLKAQSAQTAQALRLTQTRLDELVARASEVALGTVSADAYASQVDDLVKELEALNQAAREIDQTAQSETHISKGDAP